MAITIAGSTPDYVTDPISYDLGAVQADDLLDSGVPICRNLGTTPFSIVLSGTFTTIANYNTMAAAINAAIAANTTITVAGFGTSYTIFNGDYYPSRLTPSKVLGVGWAFSLTMRRAVY
jgi:hypothetical protein